MSANAEITAIEALRNYLLRALPAKVDSINAARAATLRAPRAGPYTVAAGAQLVIGTTIGTALGTVDITAGSRTAAEVAADITAAALSGLTASADSQGRLLLTSAAVPVENAPSTLWLGPDALPGSNAAFGWGPGGHEVAVSAIVAPTYDGIRDGLDGSADMGRGFWVEIGQRSSAPTDNIRRDLTLVTLRCGVVAPEPLCRAGPPAMEYLGQCVRAVRECIYEDRSLDGAVYIAEVPAVQSDGRNFSFKIEGGVSGLMAEAPLTVLIKVYERN